MTFEPQQALQKGRYTVQRVLKSGRFGISYLAKDRQGNPFVIKTLRDDLIADLSQTQKEQWSNRFLREAGALAKFQDHPNIVKFQEPFLEQGVACLVMEYVAGTDLGDLAQPKLPEAVVLDYVRQVGAALQVVHDQGLVHRDVKPSNIVLRSGEQTVVLIDFGLARMIDETLHTNMSRSSTEDGFAPPEVYGNSNAIARPTIDVYGLAATLYALLAGEPPPSAEALALGSASLRRVPDTSRSVWRAINQGMALDEPKRSPTIADFLALLPSSSAPKPESDSDEKIALEQLRIGRQTLWVTLMIGVLSIVVGVALTVFGDRLKDRLDPPPMAPPAPNTQ